MRKQLFGLMLTGFFLLSLSLVAQTDTYPTKKVKGVEYYIYTVQPHEGMYAISRRFEVSQAEINSANPQIEDGLKVGQEILIPISGEKPKQIQKVVEKPQEQKFIEYKVEKKQTLFAISRKYDVSQDDIKKLNPEIIKGLREGMILRIPIIKKDTLKPVDNTTNNTNKPITSKQKQDINNTNLVIHVVQQGETLYSISNKYNVNMMDVIQLNPGSADHITLGEELKIPVKSSPNTKENLNKTEKSELKVSPITNNQELIPETNKTIRIAYLLPFMLDQTKPDASTERFLDFYGGSLIAIQEAKKKSISLEIYAYDTENSEEKITQILNNPEIKTMNLIIGPAFSNQVGIIGDFARENKINTLIPFTSKIPDIETNPYLFQFNPGNEAAIKLSTELLSDKLKNYHVVFANLQEMSDFDAGKIWAEKLKAELVRTRKSFSQINLTSADNVDLSTGLKRGEKNLVIFNTDKYAFISPYLSALKIKEKEYKIILFEQYSWINQDNKLSQSIYICPFDSKINSEKLSIFNGKFSQYFKRQASTDVPRFDLLGYDLTNYFINSINRYGVKFTDKMETSNSSEWLQSQPVFERISRGSGFINQ